MPVNDANTIQHAQHRTAERTKQRAGILKCQVRGKCLGRTVSMTAPTRAVRGRPAPHRPEPGTHGRIADGGEFSARRAVFLCPGVCHLGSL
jgi:hypothetical protein